MGRKRFWIRVVRQCRDPCGGFWGDGDDQHKTNERCDKTMAHDGFLILVLT